MSETMLRFWGVRGSIPSPGERTVIYGGNTSCVEVRAQGKILILDAGTGIRPLGLALAREFDGRPIESNILITHTHWDHIQGFPFFGPAYNPKNTTNIYGVEGSRQGLQSTLSVQMDRPYFPVSLDKMPGGIHVYELKEPEFCIGMVRVKTQLINHPGTCAAYRIETPDGSICYVPDVELDPVHSRHPEDESSQVHNGKLIEFIRRADIAIIDSQYNASELCTRAGSGHSCVEDVVMIAARARVKRLFLFHHDPDHTDADVAELEQQAREAALRLRSPMSVEAAREGAVIRLDRQPNSTQTNE